VADKQITVEVPEERVAEFYSWFAEFLSAPSGGLGSPRRMRGGPGRHRGFGPHGFGSEPKPWTADDIDQARWLYRKLSDPARQLFDLLIQKPGARFSGNEIASQLKLENGAHGVAGVLAWPGRWCRKLGREFPIDTDGREDGGTDFFIDEETAAVFEQARRTS
jgi:hypothetical protein